MELLLEMSVLNAIPNAGPYLELSIEGQDYYPWQEDLFLGEPFKVSDGHVVITDKPGWGIMFNPDWLEKASYKSIEL